MKYYLIAEPDYNEDSQCREIELTEEEVEDLQEGINRVDTSEIPATGQYYKDLGDKLDIILKKENKNV